MIIVCLAAMISNNLALGEVPRMAGRNDTTEEPDGDMDYYQYEYDVREFAGRIQHNEANRVHYIVLVSFITMLFMRVAFRYSAFFLSVLHSGGIQLL